MQRVDVDLSSGLNTHGWILYIYIYIHTYIYIYIHMHVLYSKKWNIHKHNSVINSSPPEQIGRHFVDDIVTLLWRHNGRGSVSNHQPHDCLLNRLFRRGSKKTSKLRVTGLCAGNSPGTGEFPAQMASNAENISIWWRHHEMHFHECQVLGVDWNFTEVFFSWGSNYL